MTPEDTLRRALQERADAVEPQSGAYERLAARVAEEVPADAGSTVHHGRFGDPSLGPRILAVAAALAVVIGTTAYFLRDDNGSSLVATVPPSVETTITPTTAVPTTVPTDADVDPTPGTDDGSSPTTTETTVVDTPIDQVPANVVVGPRRNTKEEAAQAFLALIHRGSAAVVVEGNQAFATTVTENGQTRRVSTLTLAATTLNNGTAGFAVVRADAPEVTIIEPAPLSRSAGESSLRVAGTGHGFEATIGIDMISSHDATFLNKTSAQGGNFGEAAPFEKDLPIAGSEWAWVVATSSGATSAVDPFSAVPIQFDAPLDDTTYIVSGIDVDDPDGGLNLRSLPTTDPDEGTVLETLPTGTAGIRRRGVVPAFVGDQVWWSVMTADGNDGWVNSRFLLREGTVSDEELTLIARQVAAALASPESEAFGVVPWTVRKDVAVGWSGGLQDIDPALISQQGWWDTPTEWKIPEDFQSEPVTATPRDFLGPVPEGASATPEMEIELVADPLAPGGVSPYGLDLQVYASEFPGASAVLIRHPESGDVTVWTHTAIFVEPDVDQARVIGIVRVFWIP